MTYDNENMNVILLVVLYFGTWRVFCP